MSEIILEIKEIEEIREKLAIALSRIDRMQDTQFHNAYQSAHRYFWKEIMLELVKSGSMSPQRSAVVADEMCQLYAERFQSYNTFFDREDDEPGDKRSDT